MANLQKNYRTRAFISRKLTRMLFVRACLFRWLGVHQYFNRGISVSKFPLYLRSPCQYHVCVLPQWRTLHGISVLLYILGIFSSDIINYHSSHRVFSSSKISKNTCAREKFQPEQQKIRSLITENPPSRNRKPRFASPPKTVHCPLPTASALMSLGPRGRQSVAAAAQRPYVLMFLCSSVFRVSGCRTPPTASALMFLEATRTPVRGRQPRSGLMCFLCELMSLMFSALSGKHKHHILCPYALMSFCFPR